MKLKKTKIGMTALAASFVVSTAFSVPEAKNPDHVYENKTACLPIMNSTDGSQTAYKCDESKNNAIAERSIKDNGCAEGQIAIHDRRNVTLEEKFSINIKDCRAITDGAVPPAQL